MYFNVILILVGDELLSGRTRDVNLQRFSRILTSFGLPILSCKVVQDDKKEIAFALKDSLLDNTIVIVTGGLGPTDDDITLKSVAFALNLPIIRSAKAELMVRSKYSGKIAISESALTQADIPETAEAVNNPVGIAPGVFLKTGKSLIICLPGVPSESKALLEPCLFQAGVKYDVKELPFFIRTWGLKENPLYDLLKPQTERFDALLAYLPSPGRVDIKITGKEAKICSKYITKTLQKQVYSTSRDETLEYVLVKKMIEGNATLSTAESCTGGRIGVGLTEIPGVSACYLGGIIAYSNEVKLDILGVPKKVLSVYGAVSKETAIEMAKGIQRLTNSDYSIAVTGIAGPSGGTPEKPVGTIWTALVYGNTEKAFLWHLSGTREKIQKGATARALGILFEELN